MSAANLFENLKKLKLPEGKYAIFGSGPMCVRGLRECRDLDVIITEDIFVEYSKKPEWKTQKYNTTFYLENEGIEIWKDWAPDYMPNVWDIERLIAAADIINDLPFVKLEEVLKWKKALRREKDLKDIKLIEDYLKRN